MTADRARLQLYLLRHADAGDPDRWQGPDAARPLSDKGRRQAERLGRFLAASEFAADAFITSPKVRAHETAELVASALGIAISLDERLAVGFGFRDIEAILAAAGSPRRAVLVGHDPDFSEILSSLAGAPGLGMRKGAMARLDIEDLLAPGAGTLRWLVSPEILPR